MKWDETVNQIAERQYALLARWQLREHGIDRNLERRRLQAGIWERAAPTVLRLAGAPRSSEQLVMIGVLAGGPGVVASHHAAAWLWQLPGFAACADVLRPRSTHHGTALHRPRLVLPHHRVEVRGIPCTSLPRTIFDLAGELPFGRMARLVDTVVTRSPAMLSALHQTLPELAASGRNGITTMRVLLEERPLGSRVPASGLEGRFEEICHNAGIRGLERQVDIGGHSWIGRVDYRRPDIGLIVEVDSVLHHTSITDRANDAARDAAALAAGWRKVLRIPEEHVWREPWLVVEAMRATIAELEGTGSGGFSASVLMR